MEKTVNETKSILSWALYDWANSAFATTVMAGFFPLFFRAYWADPANPDLSTFYLGAANSAASVIVALFAPFLGAVADCGGRKKKFLFFFAFLGVIMTGALSLVEQGRWMLAVFFYVSAVIGFSGGNVFYDSLLPGVASGESADFISALGYGLGYIGGGLLFLVNVLMYMYPHGFGFDSSSQAIRVSFLSVAVWWAVFSLPVFFFVKEPDTDNRAGPAESFVLGWRQLMSTFREFRMHKTAGLFLLAYWLYIDGVDTIIRMAVDYGASLGFEGSSLIAALLMVQFIAFPASVFYGKAASFIGTKKAILIAIIAYSIITLFAAFISKEWHFFVLAGAIALFQGGIQALSRSFYSTLIPHERSAEFFGFYNMLGKFAVVLGPVLMGWITVLTGNARMGIVSILVLFLAGGLLLLRVREE